MLVVELSQQKLQNQNLIIRLQLTEVISLDIRAKEKQEEKWEISITMKDQVT